MSGRERVAKAVERTGDGGSGAAGVGLTLLAAAIAAVLVLPLLWLVVDAAGLGTRAFELAVDPRTIEVLVRSVALVAIVTGASIVIGVPLAVLTVQGEIPFPRFWTVLIALPLAVPSYLARSRSSRRSGHRANSSASSSRWESTRSPRSMASPVPRSY